LNICNGDIISKAMNENAMHQPTMTVDEYGTKRWKLNSKLHREDGPAIEHASGTKAWYLHGKMHREDGPAIECANRYKEWWLHSKWYEDVFAWARALLTTKGINDPSEDEINDKVQQMTSSSILD